MSLYHILTLDGGGIRGVLTASLLERIEAEHPGFLAKIDLFAGTSTGGILALGLASGMTPTQARELYENMGASVFQRSLWREIRDLDKLIGPDYPNEPLKADLTNHFGDMTLGDLPKKVLVSSFDLDNQSIDPAKPRSWKPKFFQNFSGPGSDAAEKVVDVALRTSAAPTFFPIYQGFVDGGVVANNPSMCALAQALNPATGGQNLKDIRLLSVGTGNNPAFLNPSTDEWGLVQWAPHLITLMLDGSGGLADYQCAQVLGRHYFRLNSLLPMEISLDRVDQIPLMKQIVAQQDLSAVFAWVNTNFAEIASRPRVSRRKAKIN
jgi:patatin-like phospholipase/acyl hydrolase